MKQIIFSLGFVCCLFLQLNAKTLDNTIVNDNSAWATLGYAVCPGCPVWTQYIYFDGDSTIADYTYKKVFSYDDESHESSVYEGLIREQNKKTYFIPANSETEYVLYDFSLEEGMTFEYIDPFSSEPISVSFYVKQVDFVEINGVQKKQIKLTELPPYDGVISATWIEDIGSSAGLFYPCGVLAPGNNRILLCYFQNDELMYKNPSYSECYYDNTSMSAIGVNTYNGKIIHTSNPCQTEPCLPGIVFGLETASDNYVLTINSNWIWSNSSLIVEDAEYFIDDEVEITGTITTKQDVNADEYTELEIKTIKKLISSNIEIFSSSSNSVYFDVLNQIIVINKAQQDQPLIFELINAEGKVILKKTTADGDHINIANLSNGVYLYRLLQNNQIIYGGKIVK